MELEDIIELLQVNPFVTSPPLNVNIYYRTFGRGSKRKGEPISPRGYSTGSAGGDRVKKAGILRGCRQIQTPGEKNQTLTRAGQISGLLSLLMARRAVANCFTPGSVTP